MPRRHTGRERVAARRRLANRHGPGISRGEPPTGRGRTGRRGEPPSIRAGKTRVIREPLSVAAVIAAVTGIAFWVEGRFEWGPKVGAALVAIAVGALLSNLGLVPAESPVYDGIFGPVTSLAIVWLLFGVRLADLRDAGLPMPIMITTAAWISLS